MTDIRKAILAVVAGALATAMLTGCTKEDGTKKTFVQVTQVEQWIVDNECDNSGGMKGFPGYGGEGMGQVAQVTFVCDNGRTFDIRLKADGTYKYTKVS